MPAFTNIFQPTLPKTSTVVEPFSFDNKYPSKDDIVNQLVTKKIEEENEVRKFFLLAIHTGVGVVCGTQWSLVHKATLIKSLRAL